MIPESRTKAAKRKLDNQYHSKDTKAQKSKTNIKNKAEEASETVM